MNRRTFIKGLGAFMILPGAGRIWKVATRIERPKQLKAYWCQTRRESFYATEDYMKALGDSCVSAIRIWPP